MLVVPHPLVRRAELVLACFTIQKPLAEMTPDERSAVDWALAKPKHLRQIAETLRGLALQHADPESCRIAIAALERNAEADRSRAHQPRRSRPATRRKRQQTPTPSD